MNTRDISTKLNDSDILYALNDTERNLLKDCLIGILKDFINICEKYNLTWILGGGSVLGAVRHEGFIPWDDDLDVMMPREDFEKLKQIFNTELSEKYELVAPNYGGVTTNLFAKIKKKGTVLVDMNNYCNKSVCPGVYIDIFPLDYAPNSKPLRFVKALIADFMALTCVSMFMFETQNEKILSFYQQSKSGLKHYKMRLGIGKIMSILFKDREKLYNKYDKFVRHKKSDYFSIPTGRKHYNGEILPVNKLLPVSKATFEGVSVNIPNNTDEYLTNLYGDYMQLPPIEKRERHFFVDFQV